MSQNLVSNDVKALRQRQTAVQEQTAAARTKISKEIEALQQKVLSGAATTGNLIDDYLLVQHGYLSPNEDTMCWHELEARMSGKKGELVLIVTRKRKRTTFRGCFGGDDGVRESDYDLETCYRLALLGDDKLAFDISQKKAWLPTESHVRFDARHGPFEKELGKLQFFPLTVSFADLPPPSAEKVIVSAGRREGKMLEIIVGDEAVLASNKVEFSFKDDEWVVARNMAARLLGKLVADAPEEQRFWAAERAQSIERLNDLRNEYRSNKTRGAQDKLLQALARAKEIGLAEAPLVKLIESEVAPLVAAQAKAADKK